MAKFKPYKILESQLDSLPIKEGQFILTTDTKKLYSDTAAYTRILISPDAITDLSVDGTTITYTHLDGTTGMINTQDTTYSVASETKNGLMSAEDKAKLNAIDAGAQKNTVTGVKGDSETLYRTGNINITKANIGLNNVENKSSATIRGELTSSNVTTALGYTPLNSNLKGVNNGLAELDASGKVPTAQLPSYVDDVLEYSAKASFPTTGETGKIYVDTSTNKTYRWGGSAYVEISQSIALGTTSSTAFRGDYGQAAYTHAVTNKGSKFDSGLYKIATNAEGHVTGATAVVKGDITALGIPAQDTTYSAATTSAAGLMSAADKTKLDGIAAGAQKNTVTGVKGNSETSYRTGNVNITKANIGLGNVDNTADADKPVSTAQQTALDAKLNLSGGTLTGPLKWNGANSLPSSSDLLYILGIDAFADGGQTKYIRAEEMKVGKATADKNGKDITTTYVKKSGDTMTGELDISGLGTGGQIRMYNGTGSTGYGSILRNDGTNTYVLLTNAGEQTGTWNDLRPLMINNGTGLVTMSQGLTVNKISVNGSTDSTSSTNGIVAIAGGVGIAKAINGGSTITAAAALKSTEGTVDLADSAAQMKYNSTDKCIDFIFS